MKAKKPMTGKNKGKLYNDKLTKKDVQKDTKKMKSKTKE